MLAYLSIPPYQNADIKIPMIIFLIFDDQTSESWCLIGKFDDQTSEFWFWWANLMIKHQDFDILMIKYQILNSWWSEISNIRMQPEITTKSPAKQDLYCTSSVLSGKTIIKMIKLNVISKNTSRLSSSKRVPPRTTDQQPQPQPQCHTKTGGPLSLLFQPRSCLQFVPFLDDLL